MATTFIDLVNAIKEEGRVDRSNDLDTMIKRIINEVMVMHTRNKEYPELLVIDQPLTVSSNGQSQFNLPADFSKIKQVKFSADNGSSWKYLKLTNQYGIPFVLGMPVWYYRAGSTIVVSPSKNIVNNGTHLLRLDYMKVPPVLVGDNDPLLIDDLYPIIVREALSRIRRYHNDNQGDAAFVAGAKAAEITSEE